MRRRSFHKVEELNAAYLSGTVVRDSFWVRPSQIGELDNEPHYVAFDRRRSWVCSDPHQIEWISGAQFPGLLLRLLAADDRPLGQHLPHALESLEQIVHDRDLTPTFFDAPGARRDHDIGMLRRLADISLRYFNAQLFIVQRQDEIGRGRP